jgi:hypothetical protein
MQSQGEARLMACAGCCGVNLIHYTCYQGIVLLRFKVQPLMEEEDEIVVCSKRCYNKIEKTQKDKKKNVPSSNRIPWDTDGPNPGISSHAIIIEWLTTSTNYDRWRGDTVKGKNKKGMAGEIVSILKANKIFIRTTDHVHVRINAYEAKFKETYEWTQNTGQGVKEVDPLGYKATINKRCPYFYHLFDVMMDRNNLKPLATNEENSSESNNESNSAEDEEAMRWMRNLMNSPKILPPPQLLDLMLQLLPFQLPTLTHSRLPGRRHRQLLSRWENHWQLIRHLLVGEVKKGGVKVRKEIVVTRRSVSVMLIQECTSCANWN